MTDRSTGYGEAQAPGRTEDLPLLTGNGRFAGDIQPDGMVHGVFNEISPALRIFGFVIKKK